MSDFKNIEKRLDKTNSLLEAILKELKRARPEPMEAMEPLENLLGGVIEVDGKPGRGPYAGVSWDEWEAVNQRE